MYESASRLPRIVWLLVTARAFNRLGAFSMSFLTVLVSSEFDAGTATAGLVAAAFGLATIPSRLIGGRLADQIGRRSTIVLGLSGCALTQLGIAASGSLAAVTAWAILLGLAYELYEPPSQAMIADAVPSKLRVRAYSLLNAAMAVGGMGAGLLAAGLGRWDLRWLFVADAVTCAVCAVVVRAVLPADLPAQPPVTACATASAGSPWRDRALLAMLAFGTAYALVHMQVIMSLPLSLEQRGLRPADAGLLFTTAAVTALAAQPLLRLRRVAALSAPAALATGCLLLAAGLVGYAMAPDLPAYALATVVCGLGDLLIMGRVLAVVADLAPNGTTGRYLAVYGISWGIATVAAPALGTQILERAGVETLWAGMAGVCLALAALLAVRRTTGRRTAGLRPTGGSTQVMTGPAPAPAPARAAQSSPTEQ
ncbi:MFS transporter [Streptomyces longisporoflavus]|uniref:MFS transporter n=1 Tax=Streptomyces longisporoflavus TaxID=28044 RepID=A0ABW7QQN6_9ACTN